MFRSHIFSKLIFILILLSTSNALAVTYDIKETTPAIENALKNRQSRYSEIQDLKAQGVVGETNKGYLEVLKPIPAVDTTVNSENGDRRVIYEAIVQQNNLGAEGLEKVQTVFGEVQRDKARSGDMMQLPTGDWVRK